MKIILSLLFFITSSTNQQINPKTDLEEMKISFAYGFIQDKTTELDYNLNGDFRLIKENGEFYALSNTELYTGEKKVEEWKVKLNKSQISQLIKFQADLLKSPSRVEVMGYNNAYYKAEIQNRSWYIKQDENLFQKITNKEKAPNLDFYPDIFELQIKDYFSQQKAHEAKVKKSICKKWYFDPSILKGLESGSKLKFSSSPQKENNEYWQIKEDFGFISSTIIPANPDSKLAIEYNRSQNLNPHMYLSIYCLDLLKGKEEKSSSENHRSFYILELNDEEMVLELVY